MFSVQKWKCSWSLLATVASVIVLVSVVHLFLYPVVPSFDYFSARQVQYKCASVNASAEQGVDHDWGNIQKGLDLDHRFPSDLHNGVVYHNAPWKEKIGRWLSYCDAIAREVNIVEVIKMTFFLIIIHPSCLPKQLRPFFWISLSLCVSGNFNSRLVLLGSI